MALKRAKEAVRKRQYFEQRPKMCLRRERVQDIVELYDTLITHQAVNVFKNKDQQVRYPLFTYTQFTNKITYLGEIYLKDGGSFISNDKLISSGVVTKVIDLMSSFVRFTTKNYTKFDADVYNCVPSNIVDFAYGSRLDTGYRLLKRCIRHGMDTRCQSLVHSGIKLFKFNESDEIGIDIQHKIPTSMKDCVYNMRIACTKK